MPPSVLVADTFGSATANAFSYAVPEVTAACNKLVIIVRTSHNTGAATQSNVAFNGDAATVWTPPVGADIYIDCVVGNNRRRFAVYTLDDPDPGTNLNVTGNVSLTVQNITVTVIQLSDAGDLGAEDNIEQQDDSVAMALAVTPTDADSLVLFSLMTSNSTSTPFTPTGAVDDELADGGAGIHSYFVGSGDVVSVGNPQTMSATPTSAVEWGAAVIEVLPADGAATQALTGSLFQKAPTFFQGAVTVGAVDLAGALFQQAPTFFTGTVGLDTSQDVAGTLFENTPTFFQGDIDPGAVDVAGELFQNTPTFFTGDVAPGAVGLTGTLFQKAPTFFAGTVADDGAFPLTGTLFQKAPTFFTGTVTPGSVALAGTLFQRAPTFFGGSVREPIIHLEGTALAVLTHKGLAAAPTGTGKSAASLSSSQSDA